MGTPTETFGISAEGAEMYESSFVPRIFAGWSRLLLAEAAPRPGQDVLDVACGTGIVTRDVADVLAGRGRVVGLDLNPAMLDVARRVRPDLEWHQGDAADLPFPAATFDLVTCQAALMFFPRPAQALREMARVARPDGAVVVLVPGRHSASPAYVRLAEVAARFVGGGDDLFRSYFAHGDLRALSGMVEEAGLVVERTRTDISEIAWQSLEEFVATEVGATPLADMVDEETYQRLLRDARSALAGFQQADGGARVPIESHVVRAAPTG